MEDNGWYGERMQSSTISELHMAANLGHASDMASFPVHTLFGSHPIDHCQRLFVVNVRVVPIVNVHQATAAPLTLNNCICD
jgi:hypothetical protein